MFDLSLKQILGNIIMFAIIQSSWLGIKLLFNSTERGLAIWTHYQAHAKKQGHAANSVVACPEPSCLPFIPKAG